MTRLVRSRRGGGRLLGAAFVGAVLTAAATIVVPFLPARSRAVAGLVLLAVAVLCPGLVVVKTRRLRWYPAGWGLALLPRSRRPARAVGGPCDGQRMALPMRISAAELWLTDSAGGPVCYRLDAGTARSTGGPVLYRHDPLG